MKIAIITSNLLSLKKTTKKGTEIIAYNFINELEKLKDKEPLEITVFASGDSDLSSKIESVGYHPTSSNLSVMEAGKHVIYELALLSKAFQAQDRFDIYHIHIGDGDIALPFAPFVKKPILITLYHPTDVGYAKDYMDLFKDCENVYFTTPTQRQMEQIPNLQYTDVIPHGIDAENEFQFDPTGGTSMMWAGRAVPQKGSDIALQVADSMGKNLKMFAITKEEHEEWFEENIAKIVRNSTNHTLELNRDRLDLAEEYRTSKLFLFPLQWEEPFGLVLTESMSCGTPVVAYARGAIPEVVKDGVTGFIVNPSDDDIRGDFIVKKTGVEGLTEAVERIYSLPEPEYEEMREACRKHVEQNFTIEVMTRNYLDAYRKIIDHMAGNNPPNTTAVQA